MRIQLTNEEGDLVLDIEIKGENLEGMVKDGYDIYLDGEELDSTVPRS